MYIAFFYKTGPSVSVFPKRTVFLLFCIHVIFNVVYYKHIVSLPMHFDS